MRERRSGREGGRGEKKRKPIFIDIVIWDVYFQEILLLLSCIRSSTSEHSTGSKFAQLSLKMHNPFRFSKLSTEKYKMRCQYTY